MTDYRSLFLGDLSVYCTEKDVKDFFHSFGPIETIKLKRGSSERNHLSYGFIRFVHPESAQLALERLQGAVFLGRPIRLGWAQRNVGKKFQPKDPTENFKTAQIHVSFISKQVDALVSEATLRSLFGVYGSVIDVTIKKSQFDQKLRIQNGCGFVHYPMNFDGIQAAIQATRNIHQVTVDRVTYDCSLSHTLEQVVENDPYLLHLWKSPLPTPPVTSSPRLSDSSPRLSDPDVSVGISSSPRSPAHPPGRKTFSADNIYGNPAPDSIIPRNSSAENSLPSGLTDVDSLLREPSAAPSRNRHRPSATFSEISVESLDAFANLNISGGSRNMFPYDLTMLPNPPPTVNSGLNPSVPYSPFGNNGNTNNTATTTNNQESNGNAFISYDPAKGFY